MSGHWDTVLMICSCSIAHFQWGANRVPGAVNGSHQPVVYIFTQQGFFAINYLDDLGGAAETDTADKAFSQLRNILQQFGLQEALNKTVTPCTVMVFLGIEVNTVTLTITIPQDKWQEIQNLLQKWTNKVSATKKQTQQLAGSLNFACRCVKSGRVYLSHILNFLRAFKSESSQMLNTEIRQDIEWWINFAPQFNGMSLMLETQWSSVDENFSSDSCLTGGGAVSSHAFVQWSYPQRILQANFNINQLECMMVVVALKVLGKDLARKRLLIHCDNRNTVLAINSGSSRDMVLQRCLRELHVCCAKMSCEVKAQFIFGSENRISDALSRWDRGHKFRKFFEELTGKQKLVQRTVEDYMWNFIF